MPRGSKRKRKGVVGEVGENAEIVNDIMEHRSIKSLAKTYLTLLFAFEFFLFITIVVIKLALSIF